MLKRNYSVICLTFAALFCSPVFAQTRSGDLPEMGTAAGSTLTIDQELQYGDAYMRVIRARQNVINDPVLSQYINDIGHRLVAHANDVKTPFYFFLINDRTLNAFAFFGGHVGMHTGVFLHAQSESELASVLAHEIAHVTQRHLARSMEEQARRTSATIAALAGSVLLAIAAPEAGIAAITATTAGNIQGNINYTRANEKEADRFGLATLERSGFDVMAMPRFFTRLADEYRYASTPPPMLLTHPLPQARITDSRARAQRYKEIIPPPSMSFHLAKARIIARYVNINSAAALDWFERAQKKATPATQPSIDYGKALVYLDSNKAAKAKPILEKLKQSDPLNNFYLDALTDVYIALKQPQKALNMLQTALDNNPQNRVLLINKANVLIETEHYHQAIRILQRYTHNYPQDTNGWDLLSTANGRLGNSEEELAARAEILALRADWDRAIDLYTRASQMAKLGSFEQARYDARIDQLMAQRTRFLALQK